MLFEGGAVMRIEVCLAVLLEETKGFFLPKFPSLVSIVNAFLIDE